MLGGREKPRRRIVGARIVDSAYASEHDNTTFWTPWPGLHLLLLMYLVGVENRFLARVTLFGVPGIG